MPKGIYKHRKGWKHSIETIEKMRLGHLGFSFSEKSRQKMALAKIGNKNMLGYTFSAESREKMRKAKNGFIPWCKGKQLSKKHREKIGIAHKGKILSQEHKKRISEGVEKHYWKKGKTCKLYGLGWTNTFKEQIRYRDEYKCQCCGMPEIENIRKLDVHHIDYDKQNTCPTNLISLCFKCHIKTNHNRKHWLKCFSNRGNYEK